MSRKTTDLIIIHCADTYARMDIGAAEIDRWHRQRGWLKIGYHFVIRHNGVVEKGRDLLEPGAHAQGYNDRSIGICMVGGLGDDNKPEANFTPEQWSTLASLVKEMQAKFPAARVIGHREVSAKACPSFDVQAWLSNGMQP